MAEGMMPIRISLIRVHVLLLFCSYSVVVLAFPTEYETPRCGYESCPSGKPEFLNVHIISHTHDDVGWLKTVDQYYYGSHTSTQNAGVQYILDSVVQELAANPERRFIYVETAFLWKWWKEQSDATRQTVKSLVNSGQLEFIGGGWSMNDEAAANYNDIIDQMSLGLRRLRALFGDCAVPRVAWQIDPFGHSREQASLFAQMGFDGLFLGRIDYQDKHGRLESKTMEMMWNASANIGKDGQLFTGILYNNYSPPPGFCFDLLCSDEPIIDDPDSADYNVDKRVDEFLQYVQEQSKYYMTNNIALTMGNDFNYQSARTWFKNLDKLIKYTNERQAKGGKVNLFYSTPSCYLYSLYKAQIPLTTKTDDFFPYASDPHAYWTGYFTSRPALKGYVRKSNSFMQACKQLHFISRQHGGNSNPDELLAFKEDLGIAQHHDAVSGTAKQHVTNDYMKLLYSGTESCQNITKNAYQKLMPLGSETPPPQVFCNALNVSQCEITETNNQFTVTIYNPIARSSDYLVRIPVTNATYKVIGPDDKIVQSQLVDIPKAVIDLYERQTSKATHELMFLATLPPVGFQTYFVNKTAVHVSDDDSSHSAPLTQNNGDQIISNEFLKVTVDGGSGLLRTIENLEEKMEVSVSQNFYWYKGMAGNNSQFSWRASGAYIFRPNGTNPYAITAIPSIVKIVKGPVVEEIHQKFSNWISQIIRLPKNARHVELEWLIGPIPVDDLFGKEIVSVFETQLDTKGEFYTDSNGREVLLRKRDYRPTWNLNVTEQVSGNYYPINSRIYLRDELKKQQVTLLTDRSIGGSSMEDGKMEIMLHRRLLHDDAFGVGEPLNEPGDDAKGLVVRGKTLILVNSIAKSSSHRDLAQKLMVTPQLSFTNSNLSPEDWKKKFVTKYSAVKAPLPPNVHLLTLEPLASPFVLLRVEHFYEKTDDPENLSKPVNVTLQDLFKEFTILSWTETSLAANQLLEDVHRLQWNEVSSNNIPSLGEIGDTKSPVRQPKKDTSVITLQPMQIRTFILHLESIPPV